VGLTTILFDLQGVYFYYRPGQPVLENCHFRLHPGEKVALTGANGSGKTTLFHLMVGLIKPKVGKVVAFGRPRVTEKDFREVRARAGILFQDTDDQLFCPTVRDDIAFGPLNLGKGIEEAEALVQQTLAMLAMESYASRITHRLSGGEKRLVALATVLAMQPEVLLLDEPANALDPKAEARLLEILTSLPQAMVIISHQTSFIEQIATRRVELIQGRL